MLRDAEAVSDSWTNWFFSMNLLNRFANRNKRFIHELEWSDLQLFSSRKLTDSNEPFRASLHWTELTSKEPGDLVSARETDAAKSKLLMSNFRINYCNWKSYLGQNCQLFVN